MENMSNIADANFCVVGASGFIGTNLSLRLSQVAKSVKAVSRTGKPQSVSASKVSWVSQDIQDLSKLRQVLGGTDFVVHLVDSSTLGIHYSPTQEGVTEDALPLLKLLDLYVSSGVHKVVFLSSGGSIYGNAELIPTPETAPTIPLSSYGVNKLSVEKFLEVYKHLQALNYVSIRASNPFGPYQTGKNKQGIIGAALISGLRGEPFEIWGDGSVVRDFIYIDDLIDGILKATVMSPDFSKFNMGSGQGASVNQVLDLCDAVLVAPIRRVYRDGRGSDVQKSILDISRANTHLDWRPTTSLKHGIGLTKQWLEANPKVWN